MSIPEPHYFFYISNNNTHNTSAVRSSEFSHIFGLGVRTLLWNTVFPRAEARDSHLFCGQLIHLRRQRAGGKRGLEQQRNSSWKAKLAQDYGESERKRLLLGHRHRPPPPLRVSCLLEKSWGLLQRMQMLPSQPRRGRAGQGRSQDLVRASMDKSLLNVISVVMQGTMHASQSYRGG